MDADGSEARGSHELVAVGDVDVDWERVEVFEGDGLFGVEFEGQETTLIESEFDFAVGISINTFEPVELVEPVGSLHGGCGMLFKRRVSHGSEGREVDTLKFPVGVELGDTVEDVEVGLIGGSDDELGGLSDSAVGWTAFEFVDPGHGVHDVALVVLHLGELVHVFDGGGFEVYGESASEEVRRFDDIALGSGHDLEMDVAVEFVFVADEVDDFDHSLCGLGSGAGDARA